MSMPKISGLLFSDFHFPDIFSFFLFFGLLMAISTALGQSPFRYVQLCRLRLCHKVPVFLVLLLNFNGPLQGFEKKEVPPSRGEGSQPTHGPGERRASYVNMKSLAKGRIRMVRKDAEKTYSVKSLAKGRLQKVHKDARKKGK